MDTKEELLESFDLEIMEVADRKIAALRQEMDTIEKNTRQALMQQAQESADRWLAQELEEVRQQHAVALSHLSDESNHKLMSERTALVDQLFEQVKEQIRSFHDDPAYANAMKEKLSAALKKDFVPCILYMGKQDESLLDELTKALPKGCTAQVDSSIVLGGFRLVSEAKGRIVDETYDRALIEAREAFLQTSGLTIC